MLSEILDLPGYFVKDIEIKDYEVFINISPEGLQICPHCGQSFLGAPKDVRYQTVEDLPISGKRCYIRVPKYRLSCSCGYKGTEHISWLDIYGRTTNRFGNWIYAFCKRMSCIDVARLFAISKHTVYRLDKKGIEEELECQKEVSPEVIGVDEISRKKGHVYATIVTATQEKKVLDVIKGRKKDALEGFYKQKGAKWCENIKIACMDAWLGFRTPTEQFCKNARIAFDHFHLAQHFSKAIDALRVAESRNAHDDDKKLYKGSRWLLLKRPEKLKDEQKESLDALLKANKNLYTVYILRDMFRQIFNGQTSHSRLIRLTNWIKQARAADIPQLNEFIDSIEKWKPYIQNSLKTNSSNSFAEGINAKIRVIQRMAYGYKDFEYLRLKIIQQFNFREAISLYDT